MAIGSTVNRQTGLTPNFLMLGREVLQHIDSMLNPGGEEERITPKTYAARHQKAMRTAHREARQKLQQSQRRQKRDYDLRLEERKYSVDDAVYRFNRSIVLGQSKKITAHFVRSLDCDTGDIIRLVWNITIVDDSMSKQFTKEKGVKMSGQSL